MPLNHAMREGGRKRRRTPARFVSEDRSHAFAGSSSISGNNPATVARFRIPFPPPPLLATTFSAALLAGETPNIRAGFSQKLLTE